MCNTIVTNIYPSLGGDPDKVTLWGQSSGAISIFDQLLANGGNNLYKGKPLFRGAIMDSGSAVPTDAVDSVKPQAVYNQVVANAGCAGRSDSLACLREVPFEVSHSAFPRGHSAFPRGHSPSVHFWS